jgi:hypothetical protein
MSGNITTDLVSIGWLTTAGFTGAAYFQKPTSGSYGLIVNAYPPGWTSEMGAAASLASLGDAADGVVEIAGVAAADGVEEAAEVAASSVADWTNYSSREAQWAYMNGYPVSGNLPAGKANFRQPLPAGDVAVGFGVSNFKGRLLLNLKSTGVALLTLDNDQQ